ncbi:hypothetical protein GPL26_25005 [Enterocloster citroniae]|uniref:Uncharacterized protein n=1 Tax=Enterocloster citroniae TaxID=358743 RepID=A0AA41K7B3_9FIRM|nr:hypothetical protein [Enterocloster citroniae]MBT9812846.1 hypothetical protein [Enterocloster citroniae]
MIPNSHVIYQSQKAAKDTFAAMLYTKLVFQDVHYIDNEMAAANLELAQLKSLADAPDEMM